MDVTAIGPEDWERLRDLRLRSVLSEQSLRWAWQRESAFRENHWRMRLGGAQWWVVSSEGDDVGLVSMIHEPGAPAHERHLTALWVEPAARRRGAGRALVDAAVAVAMADGVVAVTVWASTADDVLGRFLDDVGFAATGEAVASPRAVGGEEERWSRVLTES